MNTFLDEHHDSKRFAESYMKDKKTYEEPESSESED
jgi:hypothetical protein